MHYPLSNHERPLTDRRPAHHLPQRVYSPTRTRENTRSPTTAEMPSAPHYRPPLLSLSDQRRGNGGAAPRHDELAIGFNSGMHATLMMVRRAGARWFPYRGAVQPSLLPVDPRVPPVSEDRSSTASAIPPTAECSPQRNPYGGGGLPSLAPFVPTLTMLTWG